VTRIDPRSGATRQYPVGHRPLAVAEIAGTLFVGLAEGVSEASGRVGGGKVVRAIVASTDIGVDPAFASDSADGAIAYAAGARLMEARTSHDGTTIEPELAETPPTVSNDARTYTFTLRDGPRFSPPSEQPITAEAVRYTIERALSPKLLDHHCRDRLLNDIVGEDAYERGRAEHISGIRVDGNRLAITLIRPSQTLPARLASPCLSVVPIGTPVIPVALSHPVASAGPYYVDSFVPGEQLVLRRNRNYEGGRPQKLDAIILREGMAPDRAGRLVEQGQADYAADPERPPTPAFAPRGRYEKAFGKAGQRLQYVRPASSVDALLLFNTRRGIFRDPSLRRAANFALDRRALAALVGGAPSSSLIPPGIPGHRVTQPYPPAGNPARARALAGGRRGTALVAVQAGDPVAEQLVQVVGRQLARIGIELKAEPAADPIALASKDKRIDALGLGWGVDYLDPFGAVNVLLQPHAHPPGFPSFFVDSRWITRLAHAAETPPNERTRVYAELDSDLARGPAPFAVIFSLPGVPQLFSKRIGCQSFLPGFEGWVDFSSLCVR
jgi:peptide/nickel transport system substrate-binding protein